MLVHKGHAATRAVSDLGCHQAVVVSGPELLSRAMSRSMILLQLESVAMSLPHVIMGIIGIMLCPALHWPCDNWSLCLMAIAAD